MAETRQSATRPPSWQILLAFGIIYFVWGSTFFAIRVGVHEVPPLLLAAMRFFAAGIVLYLWLLLRGEASPTLRQWGAASLLATLIFVLDYGCLFWAEQRVPSGIAAVILATIPVFIALMEILFLRTQKLTARLGLALLIGHRRSSHPDESFVFRGRSSYQPGWSRGFIICVVHLVDRNGAHQKTSAACFKTYELSRTDVEWRGSTAGDFHTLWRIFRILCRSNFLEGVVCASVSDCVRFDHRLYGVRLAFALQIADASGHLRVCESGGGCDPWLFCRGRNNRDADRSGNASCVGERHNYHHCTEAT